MSYSIVIIAKNHELGVPVKESLLPLESDIFVGTNYPSFSKLVNDAILFAKNETVIICSHKVRPTKDNVDRMLKLLSEGYGLVGMYRFAFFGFNKELIRRIGLFDERFVGGGYEDSDMILRLFEANIAVYEAEEIVYNWAPTSWNYERAKPHHNKKWLVDLNNKKITRRLSEETYSYYIGPSNPNITYKTKDYTITLSGSIPALKCEFIDLSK